ncbi:MAG TPA: hypothetical protein VGH56_06120 [Solirubrobacteraceae bacterium]
MTAAVFNLNGKADYAHWHFFQMSVPNLIVIGLMLVVFAVALVAPFPGNSKRRKGG